MRVKLEKAMSALIGGTVFLALALGWQVRGAGVEISTTVVPDGSNPVLTVANFVRIKKFILAQGEHTPYGSRTDNPYWPFPGFDVYLEPRTQWFGGEMDESEFNELFAIEVTKSPGGGSGPRINFPRVSPDESGMGLRIFEYYSKKDPQLLVQAAAEYFSVALAEIDRQTNRGESGKPSPAANRQ